MSLRNQKQNLAIRIDEYKVSKLDDATAEEKLAYASNWSDLVRKQMNADIVVPAEKKSTIQESVNLLSDYFKFAEVGCKSLTSCEFGYEGNPAENVMYLLYFLSSSDKDSYKRIEKKVKEGLYPFNGVIPKLENSNQSETERADWGFMAVYKFPICPVSDIIQGKSSARTQLFGEYVKTSADNSVTRDQLIQRLKSVNFKTGTQPTEWDSEFVISVDLACHRLLTSPKDAELLSLVTSTYLNMFNSQFGQLKSLEKKDIVDLIYTNQAYTGYRSLWLINPIIMQEREGQLETTETQANQYTEWKSILKSLIALNLYETQ